MRASLSVSRLTKFLVNSIHIYGSKSIYYENTFRNTFFFIIGQTWYTKT